MIRLVMMKQEQETILINVGQVRCVTPTGTMKRTVLHFDGSHKITVDHSIEEVYVMLQGTRS